MSSFDAIPRDMSPADFFRIKAGYPDRDPNGDAFGWPWSSWKTNPIDPSEKPQGKAGMPAPGALTTPRAVVTFVNRMQANQLSLSF